MQCDETISHFVTAGRSHFRTLRNACLTAGKNTMTAGKIKYGCFEILSWPQRTSNNIINICIWLLETCTKCSYFIEKKHATRSSTFGIWSEVRVYRAPIHEYTVGRRSTVEQVSRQPALDVLATDRTVSRFRYFLKNFCMMNLVFVLAFELRIHMDLEVTRGPRGHTENTIHKQSKRRKGRKSEIALRALFSLPTRLQRRAWELSLLLQACIF